MWICSDRPTRPICRKMSMKSGLAVSISENSSMQMNSAGSGSRSAPFSLAFS